MWFFDWPCRLRRVLGQLLFALSLLLFVLVAAGWLLGPRHGWGVCQSTVLGESSYALDTQYRAVFVNDVCLTLSIRQYHFVLPCYTGNSDAGWIIGPYSDLGFDSSVDCEILDVRLHGFFVLGGGYASWIQSNNMGSSLRRIIVIIPYWLVAGVFCVLPLRCVFRRWYLRRRRPGFPVVVTRGAE